MPELQFPPYALILFFSAALNLNIGIYSITRVNDKALFYFGLAFISAGLGPLIYSIQLMIADFELLRIISHFMPVPMQFFPLFFLISMHLLVKNKMPPPWLTALIATIAVAQLILIPSSNYLFRVWESSYRITTIEGYNIYLLVPGLWLKFSMVTNNYAVNMIVIFLLAKGIQTHKQPYKTQYALIILAIVIGLVINILYIFRLVSFGPYNPIPGSFIITTSIIALAMFRYGLLTIAPYARETVFELIDSPVLIADNEERLIDFNPKARDVFRLSNYMIGKSIYKVFTMISLDWTKLINGKSFIFETKWGTGANYKFSTIKQAVKQGNIDGYIVIFNDITDQMDAMQTEHEKEIVTYKETVLGDMHDGIGGVVATGAIIAQSAMEEENIEEKNKMIERISLLLQNGSFELRSMLNILDKEEIDWRSLVSDMRGFSSTVLDAQMIERRFKVHGDIFDVHIGFDQYISIFRLFKEGITNIIKHSKANLVTINVYFDKNDFRFSIQDDGIGINESKSKGFGLKNMQKRIEKLNGKLEINSGNGTTVEICIPVM